MSQIQRFIPKKWKQSIKPVDIRDDHPSTSCNAQEPAEGIFTSIEASMIDSLLTSLKEFTSRGNILDAFKTFSLIRLHASSTSQDLIHPISSLLSSCTDVKFLAEGQQLHGLIISLGFEQHPVLVRKLVTFYSTFSLLVDAHVVTENSNILNPLPWNLLISAYVRNGLSQKALSAYKQMVSKGIRPDNFTYPSVLKACGEELDLCCGKEVHKAINVGHTGWSLIVHNALISMYGKCGEVVIARDLFDKMPERDAISWNSMISVYTSMGKWNEAFLLFRSMGAEGIELNIIMLNTMAGGYLRTGNYKGALELLYQMRKRGSHLDSVAMLIGLGACSHIGDVKLGKVIHGFAIRSCFSEVDTVKNALITMYARCKDLRHAYLVFQSMEAKSLITWNSIISGCCHMDRSEEASFLLREMLLSGIEPNYVTIASVLPLCARVANLQHGKEFHCYMTRRELFKDYLLLWNALVDMYARSGKVLEARRVFDMLDEKDKMTYTSMIAGYGMQGEGRAALELFKEMNDSHIKPDHITMIAVLSACSHSGLVTQGQLLFEKMRILYGLTPHVEHFACMADLFGRAGLLYKAKEIIRNMPYRPTHAMWATLIGACRIHRNTEIGEWAAEKLLEMKPENPGYYVLIANMYAAAGCWHKLAKVRTFMRDLGVRKAPGCAWVDVGSGFSPFLVDDISNARTDEIHPLLEGLTLVMKEAGYISSEEFGSDDETSGEFSEELELASNNRC